MFDGRISQYIRHRVNMFPCRLPGILEMPGKIMRNGYAWNEAHNKMLRPEFATSFFEKRGLSQCSRGSREKSAIIFSTYISERLDA